MGSTRLPGKVLLPLAGESVLSHVVKRCQSIPGVAKVCCAIPEGDGDDALAAHAAALGATVVRGDEHDVLARYWRAAHEIGCDTVLRVTSDCPLIDPWVCGDVLALLKDDQVDYACNHMPRSWPHGLDCGAFRLAWLDRAYAEASTPREREHVVTYIRLHPEARLANLANPIEGHVDWRWTLDTPADYAFMQAMFDRLPAGEAGWHWEAARDVVLRDPGLAEINLPDGRPGNA
ncbi:MAG: glycosyltransferase family protein [Burkholderiales bacterium]|nr:glycosyltransferase family protein [Burkholderiales bacterium]